MRCSTLASSRPTRILAAHAGAALPEPSATPCPPLLRRRPPCPRRPPQAPLPSPPSPHCPALFPASPAALPLALVALPELRLLALAGNLLRGDVWDLIDAALVVAARHSITELTNSSSLPLPLPLAPPPCQRRQEAAGLPGLPPALRRHRVQEEGLLALVTQGTAWTRSSPRSRAIRMTLFRREARMRWNSRPCSGGRPSCNVSFLFVKLLLLVCWRSSGAVQRPLQISSASSSSAAPFPFLSYVSSQQRSRAGEQR